MMFCILWVRATFPRFRYDQLMRLGWKGVSAVHPVLAGADRRRLDRVRLGPVR